MSPDYRVSYIRVCIYIYKWWVLITGCLIYTCVCVYVYIYIYIYIYAESWLQGVIYTCVYIYIYINDESWLQDVLYIYVCVCIYIYVYIYKCWVLITGCLIYTCVYIYINDESWLQGVFCVYIYIKDIYLIYIYKIYILYIYKIYILYWTYIRHPVIRTQHLFCLTVILNKPNNNNFIIAAKHNIILLFNLLATSFGNYTIIRPSLHEIQNRLHVAHIKFNVVWDPIEFNLH